MTSGDEAVVHRDPASGFSYRVYAVVASTAGLACLLIIPRTGMAGVLMAGFFFGSAAFFHLPNYVRPRPDKRVRQELGAEGVRIVMQLRPQRPLAMLSVTAASMMLFSAGLFLMESALWRVALVTLMVAVLVFVPDSVRGLLARDRGVTLTSRALTYRGWSYDVEVLWEDIVLVSVDASNPYLPCIRVDLISPGNMEAARHRIILGLEPQPGPDRVMIPTVALDPPRQLIALARHLIDLPAHARHEYLACHGLSLLTGPSSRSH